MELNLIEKILSGEASPVENTLFEKWLSESDDHREYFEKLKIIWQTSGTLYNDIRFDEDAAKKSIHMKIAERRKKKQLVRYRLSLAASFLLIIGLTFLWFNKRNNPNPSQLYSADNIVKMIILPDSSHIWLNKHSQLVVADNLKGRTREVTLKGEAYFEIARDEKHPFKIAAGNTITEILGTSFNISMDTLIGDVRVIVNGGKVAFYQKGNPSQRAILTSAQKAEYHEITKTIKTSSNSDQNYLAWKTGTLTFSDTPLTEVCIAIGGYFNKNISVDTNISDLSVTGTFRNEKMEDILKSIEMTFDVKATINENEVFLHK